jgi:hypothetical protein
VWSNRWNAWQGKPKYSEKTCPSAAFSTTIRTWTDPGSNPGRRGGKLATDHMNYVLPTEDLNLQLKFVEDLYLQQFLDPMLSFTDRLCGLVVKIPGYRSRGHGFDSQHYQIFWEVVGLERGPLSLVSTTEELLGRKSSDCGLENLEYGRRNPLCWPRNTLYP